MGGGGERTPCIDYAQGGGADRGGAAGKRQEGACGWQLTDARVRLPPERRLVPVRALRGEHDRVPHPERYYYVCGSQPYRKGMGCGPGVYVPQKQVEAQVLSGVASVLGGCSDPKGFTSKVNTELRRLWEDSTGFRPDSAARMAMIDKRIANVRQGLEDGFEDAAWANARLASLRKERAETAAALDRSGTPPE